MIPTKPKAFALAKQYAYVEQNSPQQWLVISPRDDRNPEGPTQTVKKGSYLEARSECALRRAEIALVLLGRTWPLAASPKMRYALATGRAQSMKDLFEIGLKTPV